MAKSTSSEWLAEPKEYLIPGLLIIAGVVIYLTFGFLMYGSAGLQAIAQRLPLALGARVVFGVAACLITARIKDIEFGSLSSAIVKIAAVSVFPGSVTFFIPWVGWFLSWVLYYKLLDWLFDLETMETVVLAIVLVLVTLAGVFLLTHLGFAV